MVQRPATLGTPAAAVALWWPCKEDSRCQQLVWNRLTCVVKAAPVLLNTLQSGSSDVCDLSHNRGHQEPRTQCSLNRQHAQPSLAVQGELVSVDAPVLPLVPDCRTSALTGGSWEQLMTGLSTSNVKLATAAPRPASGEPVVVSSLRTGAFEGPRFATEEAVGIPQLGYHSWQMQQKTQM